MPSKDKKSYGIVTRNVIRNNVKQEFYTVEIFQTRFIGSSDYSKVLGVRNALLSKFIDNLSDDEITKNMRDAYNEIFHGTNPVTLYKPYEIIAEKQFNNYINRNNPGYGKDERPAEDYGISFSKSVHDPEEKRYNIQFNRSHVKSFDNIENARKFRDACLIYFTENLDPVKYNDQLKSLNKAYTNIKDNKNYNMMAHGVPENDVKTAFLNYVDKVNYSLKSKESLNVPQKPMIFNSYHSIHSKPLNKVNDQYNNDELFLKDIKGVLESKINESPAPGDKVEQLQDSESAWHMALDLLMENDQGNLTSHKKPIIFNEVNKGQPKDFRDVNHNQKYNAQSSNQTIDLTESPRDDFNAIGKEMAHLAASKLEKTYDQEFNEILEFLDVSDSEENFYTYSSENKNKKPEALSFDDINLDSLIDDYLEGDDLTGFNQPDSNNDRDNEFGHNKRAKPGG